MNQITYFILTALLASAGWAFSFYFVRMLRDDLQSNIWWIPQVCRMSVSHCKSLAETVYGSILGKPNAYWGMLYYPMLISIAILVVTDLLDIFTLVVLASFASMLSLYLLWGLYRLRARCTICFATHISNFLILMTVINWEIS